MLSFVSFWRASAIVLCDLGSSAYYVGGIAEKAVGKAAPWFILAIMLFSYAVRAIYIESCSMFVRGGVYRVVREAMGGTAAKFSVSALMFDYVLTGPISGVSAGLYLAALLNELGEHFHIAWLHVPRHGSQRYSLQSLPSISGTRIVSAFHSPARVPSASCRRQLSWSSC
jgi:amino acid transporter